MKKLKKILLINWLYFSKELIEVGDVNFLTGKNGAGKSTVIDALQIALLGETNARNFNQAANEKSQRTLDGYLRADMDENNPYSRRGKDFFAISPANSRMRWKEPASSPVLFSIAAVTAAGRNAFSFMWALCRKIALSRMGRQWRFPHCAAI